MLPLYVIFLLLALLGGGMMLWRVPLLMRNRAPSTISKTISIIIPARNEELNLPHLLRSLQTQTLQPLEILVVDDHSEDNTSLIAAQHGARVIHRQPDETGWIGKSAVCWEGAQAAQGDWLLFLDADIFLAEKDSLEKMASAFQNRDGSGVLSIQPYHVVKYSYENLSAIFNIMVLAGMNRFSFLRDRLQPAGAFGPTLLCDRQEYFQIGGHEQVRNSIMENVQLGKLFLEHGLPVSLYGGKDAVHFRMYPEGMQQLSQGWSKSFASASLSTHPMILAAASGWIGGALLAGAALPLAFFLDDAVFGWAVLLGYLLYFLQFSRMAHLVGNFHWLALFFYPVLFLYFIFLFIWSSLKTHLFHTVSWKGRKIRV